VDIMTTTEKQVLPYLDGLRTLDFVQGIEFSPNVAQLAALAAGVLRVRTPEGTFAFDRKTSYLDRSIINAFINHAKHRGENARPMLLLARYVPLPSAEKLVESGVNFLDRVGNMHLALGTNLRPHNHRPTRNAVP
jgi:hypothetical protein